MVGSVRSGCDMGSISSRVEDGSDSGGVPLLTSVSGGDPARVEVLGNGPQAVSFLAGSPDLGTDLGRESVRTTETDTLGACRSETFAGPLPNESPLMFSGSREDLSDETAGGGGGV